MTHSLPRRTRVTAMSDQTFDTLRFIAQVVLPALGTLYFAIAQIWHLPFAEEVVGTIVALDAALGLILGYNRKRYLESDVLYDGTLEVTRRPDPAADLYSLDLSTPLEEVPEMPAITLKVNNNDDDEGSQ